MKICSALNRLIEISRAQKLIFDETICLHWTRKKVEFDPVDLLATANQDPAAVAKLIKSVQDGNRIVAFDANAYYAVSLSGNGGRIVVRDWLQSTVPEIRNHIAKWFLDIGIVEPGGVNIKREFSLGNLLWSLTNRDLQNPFDALPHGAAEDLLRSALTGGSVPQSILAAALHRETVDRASGGDEPGQQKPFVPARFALLKLYLSRSPNTKNHHTMSEKLDPNSKDVAYLCGQLLPSSDGFNCSRLAKSAQVSRSGPTVAWQPGPPRLLGPLFTKVPAYLRKAKIGSPARHQQAEGNRKAL